MPLTKAGLAEKILQPKWLVLMEFTEPIGSDPNAAAWWILDGEEQGYFFSIEAAEAKAREALNHPKAKRAVLVGSTLQKEIPAATAVG